MVTLTRPGPGKLSGPLPQPIGYLLIDGFSMMAFVAATEPLRIANRIAGRGLFRWQLISEDGAAVTASNGMRVLPDHAIANTARLPSVAVCSGFLADEPPSDRLAHWLRRLSAAGSTLGGIDTGCFLLAQAGLLDDVRVALHWESLPAFRERFPLVPAVESLYELGARRFSCAGGMAAADMMLDIIEREYGSELAHGVAEQLIHDRMRDARSRQRLSIVQRLGVHHSGLVRAIALMETHLDEPIAQSELAERVGLSSRQLQRLFADELASTPAAWYRRLRLEQARQLLRDTDMSVTEIALAVGFRSAAAFSRAYRQHFDHAPGRARR